MHPFDFAPELVDHIFDALAHFRELKRFMRLRLVSHLFKQFVDKPIFRLRLLDVPYTNFSMLHSPGRYDAWCSFAYDYLAYQAWIEKEPGTQLGRIRRTAAAISDQVGDVNQAVNQSRLSSSCRLAHTGSRQRHE
ncbi:Uu.00g031790.m01.CDS01 [Anthostomella pinea]|uniref:Uu.00g031790.m01.CDS01 n=1 Tax=Anthostomella pinea TaxID=933095 RepID=A0AAI8YD11_9PEZI|nr:Uu.00g031790.m01.CDS01 [Anthostomella pinea]